MYAKFRLNRTKTVRVAIWKVWHIHPSRHQTPIL